MENEIENQSAENQNDSTVEQPQDNIVKQEKVSEEEIENAKKGFWKAIIIGLVISAVIVLIEALDWGLIAMTAVAVVAIVIFLIVKLKK